jgi:iron(III) transport system substrate-binding protein
MSNGDDQRRKLYDWKEDTGRFLVMLTRQFPLLGLAIVGIIAGILLPLIGCFKTAGKPEVIVYTSQDQVYAEPLLREFEKESGIKVRAVFDSEAVKTVAIANRLLAERSHPQCDVYWGNEELRTRQLAARNIFRETNGWAAFGYRSRRLVMSGQATNLPTPASLLDLTNAIYRGRVALAYPLFGTTATHLLALRQHWGEAAWQNWCRALAANQSFLVDGNSGAVRFVVRGEAAIGLTDSDDIAAEIREGARLKQLPMTGETLLIPNTVAVVRQAPHPRAAQQLFDFLQRAEVVQKLVAVNALEGVSKSDIKSPTLQPNWDALLRDLDVATGELQKMFRR